MKAAVLSAIGQPLEIRDVPRPEIAADEVLIESRTCGICRTDIHIQDGLAYVPSLPHVPGHEPAGVVVAVGERVAEIQIGQRVVPHLFLTCGTCVSCRSGRDAQCLHVGGIIGVTTWGGFAQYFKAPARNLLQLPDGVPFDIGGLTSCAVITAVHAYRRARIQVGDPVAVLGTGGIGQLLIQILKQAGARVVGLSRSPGSLQLAQQCGADLGLISSQQETSQRVREFSGGMGVTCVFECVGNARSMQLAAECTTGGGQIIVIGEEPDFPAINTIEIAQRELEIIGSRNGSKQDAADALSWMAQGIVKPPIVKRVSLSQINEGMLAVREGTAHGRVVVTIAD
ncbi:MAG: alcohol dehydrogenase catalytic domain-containing protein [Pirellulales bacterium]